jgi:hypothetical protein
VDPVLPAVHYPQVPLVDDDGRWPQPLDSVWILPDEGMDFDGGVSVWRPLWPRPGGGGERIFTSRVFREAEKFADCPHGVCQCRWRAVDECIPQWRRRRWASAPRKEGRGASASTPAVKQVSVSLAPGVSIQEEPGLKRYGGGGVHGMQMVEAAPAPPPPAAPVAAPGGYQPFVGANRVGAANNLALWDDHGRLSAYVDYGFPAPHNRNTYPAGTADPCVCADPLVVLTHWDYDHYAMARRVPRALRLRWVAPEQKYGTAAIKYVYQPLLDNAGYGARLMLWRDPAGHVAAPFGVLVRADGTTLNESGIAAYVRADPGEGREPTPAGPQLARQEKPSPLIVAGRLPGEWIDDAVLGPFTGEEVVVSAAVSGSFAAPAGHMAADRAELIEGVSGLWIPPEGFPCDGGGRYVPSGGRGGWALSARDFVRAGGCILDFPDAGTGRLGARVYSPTPGAGQEWTAGGGAGSQTIEGRGLEREDRSWWRPVWAEGLEMEPCRMEVPATHPETLAVSGGRPPLGYGSAWLLLPGDAGFQNIPPQREAARRSPAGVALTPRVVGLVATHHGADTWISPPPYDDPDISCIPFATGRDDCRQIVYCYGTRSGKTNPGGHCYARNGVDGHPHARAIAAYEAHNWGIGNPGNPGAPFCRLNAAPEDYQSRQPFNPLAIPAQPLTAQVYARGHRSGNVALGWDAIVGGPLASDHLPAGAAGAQPPAPGVLPPLRRTCPRCPDAVKERDYYF